MIFVAGNWGHLLASTQKFEHKNKCDLRFEKVLFCPGSEPWSGCLLQTGAPPFLSGDSHPTPSHIILTTVEFPHFLIAQTDRLVGLKGIRLHSAGDLRKAPNKQNKQGRKVALFEMTCYTSSQNGQLWPESGCSQVHQGLLQTVLNTKNSIGKLFRTSIKSWKR